MSPHCTWLCALALTVSVSGQQAGNPLIGQPVVYSSSPGYRSCDVAYDARADMFAFVDQYNDWLFSSQASQGQLVSPDGSVGAYFPLEVETFIYSSDPRIASIGASGMFVAVWEERGDLSGTWTTARAVDATTGTVYPEVGLPLGTHPDIGGTSGNTAVVVADGYNGIEALQLTVSPTGIITVGALQILGPGSRPSIAQSAGKSGRFLVAWHRQQGPDDDIYGAVLDENVNVLDAGPILVTAASENNVSVSGDGDQWMVAYETSTGGLPDVGALPVFWSERYAMAYPGPTGIVASGPGREQGPAVTFSGDSYLVAYIDSTNRAIVQPIDAFSAMPCGPNSVLSSGGSFEVALSSQAANAAGAGEATLCVWLGGGLTYQRYQPIDGAFADLGGGCGGGGRADASCALLGNADFALRLRDGQPNSPAWLLLGASLANAACGPCTLVPDPLIAVGVGNTDIFGNARLAIAIPNQPSLLGGVLVQQWVQPGPGCVGLAFSDAQMIQFE